MKYPIRILFMKCSESSRLLSESLDRPLSRSERTGLRLHSYICRSCRRFKAHILQIQSALRDSLGDSPSNEQTARLSAEARERLTTALRAARS